jgi:hypothetical protein
MRDFVMSSKLPTVLRCVSGMGVFVRGAVPLGLRSKYSSLGLKVDLKEWWKAMSASVISVPSPAKVLGFLE